MRTPQFSLSTRLFLLYIAVVGLLLVGVGFFIYNQAERLFLDSRTEQAKEVVYWAMTHTEPVGKLRANDLTGIAEKLSYSPSPDLSLFLLDRDGNFLFPLGQGSESYPAPLSSPALTSAVAQSMETSFVISAGDREHRTLAYLFPVLDTEDALLGFVQSETNLEEVDAALTRVRVFVASGFGVSFVVACALWFIFAKATLRPVEEMTRVSSAVAGGDLSRRVALPRTRDELHNTVLTFNTMLDFIQEYVRKEKESQERTKRFFADAAHEFRSPLTVLKGYTDVLLQGGKDDPATLESSLQTMRSTLGRLTKLTNDMLTLGRLDTGMEIKFDGVDMDSLCQEVCEIARVIAESREVVFQPGNKVVIKGDAELLRRVLWNLVENAIQYTRPDGKITVSVAADEARCQIVVRDNGEGIAPEHLPHVFKRFYRASRSRPEGTGLGLAIARAIVEAHGGRITIESIVNSGTAVTISLPVND